MPARDGIERAARFDRIYRADPDPWAFRTSPYERAKYRATLAALPRERYRSGIEAGCSIGELTRLLSQRCDQLLGIDVSAVAIEEAVRKLGDRRHVRFLVADLPRGWPALEPDLIVLSEVLYFLTADEIGELATCAAAGWSAGGDCVLVNYLGPTDEALDGDAAATLFIEALAALRPVTVVRRDHTAGYRLDVLRAEAVGV